MTEQARNETRQEAKILSVLKHPYIINFREVFVTVSNKLCIVMDYAEGGDLQHKIRQAHHNHFPESQILDWFTQICLGLKHVHDRKILHRDIKGQNVFLTRDKKCLLGDFGIAKVLDNTKGFARTMIGTPYYLSPEIINRKKYNFKSDIWSLGVLLYELCTLKQPFSAPSLDLLAIRIVEGSYSPIPSHYSEKLKRLVEKLLMVDPKKRPTINQILEMDIMQSRIKNFLDDTRYNSEFSHTVLHNIDVTKEKPSGKQRGLWKQCDRKEMERQRLEKEKQLLLREKKLVEEKGIDELKQEIKGLKLQEVQRAKFAGFKHKQIEEFQTEKRRIESSERKLKEVPRLGKEVLHTPRVRVEKPLERKYSDQKAKNIEDRKRILNKEQEEKMKIRKYISDQRKKLTPRNEIPCDLFVKQPEVYRELYKKPEVMNANKPDSYNLIPENKFIDSYKTPKPIFNPLLDEQEGGENIVDMNKEYVNYREKEETSASTCIAKEDQILLVDDKKLIQSYLESKFGEEGVKRIVESLIEVIVLVTM